MTRHQPQFDRPAGSERDRKVVDTTGSDQADAARSTLAHDALASMRRDFRLERSNAPRRAIDSSAVAAATASGELSLDRDKSVEELMRAGKLRKVGDRVDEGDRRASAIEKIKVAYQDLSNDPSERVSRPDFRIRKDGSVEVLSNPDRNNRKDVVIEVERDQGQITGPTEAQKKSADTLVMYLSRRLMQAGKDGRLNGVIEDQQGLVSDSIEARLRTTKAPEQNLPEPVRQQVESMRRFEGGGRGTLSPEQADSYFTPREKVVPRRPDESSDRWSMKETVAGMLAAGAAHPYEAVRSMGDRGFGVGRYLLTRDLISTWLTDLMGNPPDETRLDQAVKDGRISAAAAAHLRSPKFQQFLAGLKGGPLPTADQIQEALPAELQETIAGDLMTRFAAVCKDASGRPDPGQVALAMLLGRVPNEADFAKPEYGAFLQAARRLGSISEARTEFPQQPLEWQEVNQRLLVSAKRSVGQAMWSRGPWSAASLEYGNLGCAASVSTVMQAAGIDGLRSAGTTVLEQKILKAGGYRVSTPQPGDIVFGRRGPGKHGHVGIVGEDGRVYHNSSAKRHWVEADLDKVFSSKRGFIDVHFVRLPSTA